MDIRFNNLLIDYCGIETLIINGGLKGDYTMEDNAYNPTQQDIIDGNTNLFIGVSEPACGRQAIPARAEYFHSCQIRQIFPIHT